MHIVEPKGASSPYAARAEMLEDLKTALRPVLAQFLPGYRTTMAIAGPPHVEKLGLVVMVDAEMTIEQRAQIERIMVITTERQARLYPSMPVKVMWLPPNAAQPGFVVEVQDVAGEPYYPRFINIRRRDVAWSRFNWKGWVTR